MEFHEAMARLETMGTEQNRKIYRRHGAGDNQFGVSFANIKQLKKEIKTDHALAIQLWNTKNTDAQTFATMIADPKEMTEDLTDKWIAEASYYMVVDSLVGNVVIYTSFAREKMEAWVQSEDEWIGRAGWILLAKLSMENNDLADSYFEKYLKFIEDKILQAKNRTREAMNNALIAIGIRNENLETLATEAARKIGVVEVDHGNTSCKTPDAESYIKKSLARKRK